ncbi:hypothetical protein CKM354_000222000 [Cercospora kikuchii]|uniref:Uncharacterized protein n=1 Tax=Cercospora kikuchii TaxID=84275 RepID=A0A9P3FDH7_9PEZI|nr:uncharacterized protein CKM354_000222000 [Cercospora kikuchii]GIZ38819.1 hypothetical protein CKM354_000222000 [Cercospora kikuchii]
MLSQSSVRRPEKASPSPGADVSLAKNEGSSAMKVDHLAPNVSALDDNAKDTHHHSRGEPITMPRKHLQVQ